jgi:hypothetical protein
MGYYINPKQSTKEQWLKANGDFKGMEGQLNPPPKGKHFVCLVDNGWMTAAGVAYSLEEQQVFADPKDDRPKYWFLVDDDKIIEEVPALAGHLK